MKKEDIEKKIQKLREQYKIAKESDRKLILIRAKILKRVLANYQSKNGFIA